MMSKTRRVIGWAFVGGSLLIQVLTVWSYAEQPDSLAAFTAFPIWVWGAIGLMMSIFAFSILRAPLSLIVTSLWAITLAVTMDEAKVLTNFNHEVINPERQNPSKNIQTIRVATVNCSNFRFGNPLEDLEKWDPDIVLLQEAPPYFVKQTSEGLYGRRADFCAFMTSGIITRFEIIREVRMPRMRNQQVTLRLPGGSEIEVVNLHLATAAIDMRVWNSQTRSTHRINRDLRRKELSAVLNILGQTSLFPATPTIIGGDFNVVSTDAVHRQLVRDFDDSFSEVGRGWGNTFHRRFPILRIDHIYATRQLRPLSSGVIVSKKTDHRIVISDLVIRD